ncbi:tRNA (adenosine(37)-N6)-dimethylallyltransferase MiaA [Epilithonimonas ginsengisoli]|uniref:tRNA dimethylallyltransferase n=1 Tax=Epilithonimonas ginsengisoli TaxID=1245592 RepID=A0ABU4JH92_9FLAO|nr:MULTISPECIES: tRNA (adenosine(37)-N6)-dimethylallyltransferase MiaA [Chryseobacterium group]MBV6880319.1 tRNA (adenosine(37)-N6)-dimethylallyltransferase MiaA [Epilithonimonas sp. FP105]MDW8549049.1 tRNA (adenosine(37)-N6)-dimethylallyltransferase MiaA [Epilithonimonas ginsengisoli]OAH74726.1 tRNA dimethylallyltransferase [Chryseobacterium sp. FP211-J200]
MKRLISIVGTTGIGKTRLAIDLANQLGTEIISCDSRQFYQEMKIGTAMPTESELAEAKHHFVGNLSINDYYSIGLYEHEALEKLDEIFAKKDVAIMVGGSGMYEKAVVEGLNDLPEADDENQKKLIDIFENEGIEPLQKLLAELDPEYFSVVDKDNSRRLLRAIDIIWQTGKTYTENLSLPKPQRNFETFRIGIQAPREIIYERINRRVDIMMENGLQEEAKGLISDRDKVALQTVGYSELFKYFDGEWDLDFAVSEIKKNSRRYAKRQITWNRKLGNVNWVNYDNSVEEALSLLEILKN